MKEMGHLGFMGGGEDNKDRAENEMKEKIRKALERSFRPEFLNRLDEIIIFSSFSTAVIQKIVEIQLGNVQKRMAGREISVSFTPEVKKFIAEKGFDLHYGARPLKRAIQTQLLDSLAQEIIAGHIRAGDAVLLDVKDGAVVFGKGVGRHLNVVKKLVAVAAKS